MVLFGTGAPARRLADGLGIALVDLAGADIGAALREATTEPVDLILFSATADAALRPTSFEALTDDGWREGADQPIELWFSTLQALSARYDGMVPPPIVVAGPSVAFSGGEGLAMLASSSEGQRSLMKSAARQLGARGFRFTWLAIDSLLFAPELAQAMLPKAQDPDPLALGARPTMAALAEMLGLLADPRAAVLTGQSLILDGGELMLP